MDWQLKDILIRLFEASKTKGQALARNLIQLLDNLRKKIIMYVKYDGVNLNVMTLTLKFVVNY
jgi:hypothetical protein